MAAKRRAVETIRQARRMAGRAPAAVQAAVGLVAVGLALGLAMGAPGPVRAAGAGAGTGKITLVWMHWNTGKREAEYLKWVERFEKENPDIDIVPQSTPWGEISTKVLAGVLAGSAPDVISVSSTWGESLAEKDALMDLRPFIAKEKDLDIDDVFPSALRLWQDAFGRQYAFPHDLDLALLFYNRDLFDLYGLNPPDDTWTWDTMLQMGKRLLKDTNGDGVYDRFAYSSWFFDWYPYVWANGGEILTPDLRASAMGSTPARQALEWYAQFYPNRLHLMPSAAEQAGSNPDAMFTAGKIGMQPVGAWYGADLVQRHVDFEFDVAHMPLSYAKQRATLLAGQGMAITVTCKHPEAAFRFITYMASREVQAAFGALLNQTPVRKSVAISKAFVNPEVPPKNKLAFVIALEAYARGDYKTPVWSTILSSLRSTFNRYFVGTDSLDTALSKFADQVASITKPRKK